VLLLKWHIIIFLNKKNLNFLPQVHIVSLHLPLKVLANFFTF
jgi:hypothetical protein